MYIKWNYINRPFIKYDNIGGIKSLPNLYIKKHHSIQQFLEDIIILDSILA